MCRYALKGDVSYRLCTRLFHCVTCEFGQMMEDALQQKLAKLPVPHKSNYKNGRKPMKQPVKTARSSLKI